MKILPLDGVWFKCEGIKRVTHSVSGVYGIGILNSRSIANLFKFVLSGHT